MNLTDAPLGLAFEGDYPESYGPDPAALRAIVQRQVGRLSGPGSVSDAQLIGILMGRRCGDLGRAQLELTTRRDGSLSLVARGEVTMSAAAYSGGAITHVVENFKEHGAGDNVRLRRPLASRSEVDEVIDACGEQNIVASVNYLTTMAAVGKGIGGPENAPTLPDFAGYHILSTPASGGRDEPVRVAVIDTGIPQNPRGDHWLDNVDRGPDNIDELDVLPAGPDGLLDYQAGHGTFVAGIIQRVAPAADIRMYRVADTDGFATDFDIAAAILQAYADGAEVINLSLGSRTVDDQPPPLMQQAVQAVKDMSAGATVIVAAAGNYGDESKVFPAALDGVEAVAGLTPHLTATSWSSFGSLVRFSAVGEGLHSVFPQGAESPVFDPEPDTFGPNASAIWSGTSFAAPQIAGAIARIVAERPGTSARDAVQLLDERGKGIAGFGKAMRILQGIG